MSDDTPATVDPMAGASVAQLTTRLCEVEAVMAVLGQMGADLRGEVTRRAVDRWREDGAAPTYRVAGLGSVSLPLPKPKVIVSDRDAFASWCAEHYSHNVTADVTLPRVPLEALGDVLDAVRRVLGHMKPGPAMAELAKRTTAQLTVAPAFEKGLLENATLADGLALAAGDGQVIDGVTVVEGADPTKEDGPQPSGVSVRLEAQAKADAIAQAQARLVGILADGLAVTPAPRELTARPPYDEPAKPAGCLCPDPLRAVDPACPLHGIDATLADVEPADGEPDDVDPPCTCSHLRDKHRGKTSAGGCTVCPPGECKRFRAAASAWATT